MRQARGTQQNNREASFSVQAPSGPVCEEAQAIAIAKRLFEIYDKDKNGVIDSSESIKIFNKITIQVSPMMVDAYKGMNKSFSPQQPDIETFLKVLDGNGDGKVDYQDIEEFALKILCGLGGSLPVVQKKPIATERRFSTAVEQKLEVPRRLFKKYDSDRDGYLTPNEAGALLKETYNNQYTPTQEDIQQWMEITDLDNDGRVSLIEFENAIVNGLEQAGIKLY